MLAGLTFWLGWRQKERERCFSFYKESVITPSIAQLDSFFEGYREKLSAEAKKPNPAGGRRTAPRDITKFLQVFSDELYAMKDAIVQRLEIYDTRAVRKVEEAIGKFDTEISLWLCSPGGKDLDVMGGHVVRAKRLLVKTIYKSRYKILL